MEAERLGEREIEEQGEPLRLRDHRSLVVRPRPAKLDRAEHSQIDHGRSLRTRRGQIEDASKLPSRRRFHTPLRETGPMSTRSSLHLTRAAICPAIAALLVACASDSPTIASSPALENRRPSAVEKVAICHLGDD